MNLEPKTYQQAGVQKQIVQTEMDAAFAENFILKNNTFLLFFHFPLASPSGFIDLFDVDGLPN